MNRLNFKFIAIFTIVFFNTCLFSQLQPWWENDPLTGNIGNINSGDVLINTTLKWSNGRSYLSNDQGGSIELGNPRGTSGTPFIDFHVGGAQLQDFNTRIINSADNRMDFVSFNGSKLSFDGKTTRFGFLLPSLTLSNSFINGFTSGNSLIFQNGNGILGIDFWTFGPTNGVMNFYANYNNPDYTQLSIKTDNTVGWGNDESWLSAWNSTFNGPGISLNKAGTHSGSTPYIDFSSGFSNGSNHIDVRIKNSGPNTLDFWTNMDIFGNGGNKIMSIKNDGVYAKKITVQPSWSDFVFDEDYKLKPLDEVEQYIKENGHLPEIPTESEVKENGVELGEMTSKLLQKIEELSLYLIDLNKQVEILKKENSDIKSLLINK